MDMYMRMCICTYAYTIHMHAQCTCMCMCMYICAGEEDGEKDVSKDEAEVRAISQQLVSN